MSLEEVRAIECGSWFGKSWSNEKIPQLKDVLESLPEDKQIFIEVKTNEEIVPYLLELIYETGISLGQLTIISFFPDVIKSIKRKESHIKCNLLIAFDHQDMPIQEILDLVLETKADGIGAQNHERLDERFIQSMKSIGKSVHVWTVNSNEEAERYYKSGIDSITTNKPLSIRKYLEALK